MIFCHKCGSLNHRPGDCSALDQHLSPPVAAVAVVESPVVVAAPESEPVFWKPRWIGGPAICSKVNRAAFGCEAELSDYMKRRCGPSVRLVRTWTCDSCGQLHFQGKVPGPSGESSGSGRESQYPRTPFIPFRQKAMREAAFSSADMELPKRDLPPEQSKKAVPVPKHKPSSRKEDTLF